MWIFTRYNQEHLGHIPMECLARGGSLPRNGRVGGNYEPLPMWLHQKPGVREGLVSGKVVGKDALGRGVGRGGAPAPVDSLCWPTKGPLEGV